MSSLSTHVLDAVRGRPAAGMAVQLFASAVGGDRIGTGVTDGDGRVADLAPAGVDPGGYRLLFDTAGYFAQRGEACFYPEVSISFTVDEEQRHYHVPLLLSPYAFSTYRGS